MDAVGCRRDFDGRIAVGADNRLIDIEEIDALAARHLLEHGVVLQDALLAEAGAADRGRLRCRGNRLDDDVSGRHGGDNFVKKRLIARDERVRLAPFQPVGAQHDIDLFRVEILDHLEHGHFFGGVAGLVFECLV